MNTSHKIGLLAAKVLFGTTFVVGTLVSPALHHHVRTISAAPVCYEDQPCWNCELDGNKVCGR